MNNEIENEKNIENESASLNDYEIEVEVPEKKGFFANILDKLKGNRDQKLLDSGNKETFQRTNRSISSMWTIASLRRTIMEKLETLNNSLFRTPEKVDQSNITTHVIGRDEKGKDNFVQTAEKVADFEPVIPIAQSAKLRSEIIIPQNKSIINNAKTAKDVRESEEEKGESGLTTEKEGSLEISSLEVEEEAIDRNIDEKISQIERQVKTENSQEKMTSTIEASEIAVGSISKNTTERETGDERD